MVFSCIVGIKNSKKQSNNDNGAMYVRHEHIRVISERISFHVIMTKAELA